MSAQFERRRGDRVATCIVARVVHPGGPKLQVMVVDLTPHGARLEARSGDILPRRFRLRFTQDGREFDAELIWHRGNYAGVRFIEADVEADHDASAPQALAHARPSVDQLRRIFKVSAKGA